MDTARVIQVIETTIARRGNGTTTPFRMLTQYWSLDGTLLATVDPLPDDTAPQATSLIAACGLCLAPPNEMHRCAGCRQGLFAQHNSDCLYGTEGVSRVSREAVLQSHNYPIGSADRNDHRPAASA